MENESAPRPKTRLGFVFAMLIAFSKATKLIVVLKALKFTKPLITFGTMIISAFLYGIWLGPWFGIGLVAMLFVHEMGHIVALRLKGYETPGPVFIPFLGAAIFAPKFDDRHTEAFVGFGGPLLGTIGALICLAVWPFTSGWIAETLLLVSYLGIFINLFNMIPISPLDGGRVTQSIGAWFKYIGLGVLLVFTLIVRQPGLLLIWILVLDGFENLRLWLRPMISGILTVSMIVLMVLGYGTAQYPWYIIVVDCVIAVGFTALYWYHDQMRQEKGAVVVDERPYPDRSVRGRWAVAYLGLSAFLIAALIWQVQHLPSQVHEGSDRMAESSSQSPPVQ